MHEATEAVMDKKSSRRLGCVVVAEMVVVLGLMGGSDDLGVDVGVMSVGEAMVRAFGKGSDGKLGVCYAAGFGRVREGRRSIVGFLPRGLIVLSLVLGFG